jgi:glycosyltransferase involved in cell wall biosynthesis
MTLANRKALHVINGEHYSGGERVQDILAETLPQYGYDVGFVCLKPDLFPKVYRAKASPIFNIPMKHKADFSPYKELADIVRSEGYDILHSHMPRTLPVAKLASMKTRVPLVHHFHSPTLFEGPSLATNIISGVLERISLIGVDRVIPCSEGMARYSRKIRIAERKIDVILNGIPAIGPRVHREDVGAKTWVFGMVALFRARKGIEYLLQAMAILKNQGHDFKLRAIGGFFSDEYESEIKALADKLGVADLVEWVGFTDKVAQELAQLDFFVLPSTHGEGLPIAILEAMSIGLPVVTTRIDGSDEVVRDGVDGYLCEPENAEPLAQSLAKIMQQPEGYSAMSEDAYQRQQTLFSDSSMSSGVARIYDDILS